MNPHRLAKTRARYLADSVPIRLGGLATNLGRIASFTTKGGSPNTISSIVEESRYFIEWIAPELDPAVASELADIQFGLTIWQRIWPEAQSNNSLRALLALQAKTWANSVLQHSGLLESASPS